MTVVVERVRAPGHVEPASATWSNALRIGAEIVMSGATASAPSLAAPSGAGATDGWGAYEQTRAALQKLLDHVQAAGGNVRNIYKLVIYLTDMNDKDEVGRARRDFFQAPYPCSTLVEVKGLVHPQLRVEVDAWARLDVDLSLCR